MSPRISQAVIAQRILRRYEPTSLSRHQDDQNTLKNTIFMPQFWPGGVKLAPGDVKP